MPEIIAETPRARLRVWDVEGDLDAGLALWGDPEVMRFIEPVADAAEVARSLEAGAAHQRRHGCQHWAAELKVMGEVVGCCGFNLHEGGPALELVIHLRPQVWGQGLATELGAAAIAAARARLGLRPIVAATDLENAAMRRVLDKLGFALVGVAPFESGGPDEAIYRLDEGGQTPPR